MQVFKDLDRQKFRILSIDGGGVKGVIPALFLERLEGQLIYEVKQWLIECKLGKGDRYDIFTAQDVTRPGKNSNVI